MFKQNKIHKLTILIIFITLLFSSFSFSQNLQIIDGWYYIDGEKFFVKGIGYETHTRPGQVPWVYAFDADLIRFDLSRIKSAGYNTIRTWGALREEELQLVEESGLKILFGIWIDPHGDFGNESFITEAYNHVNDVLNYSANFNSIIGYLIMNEPQVDNIYNSGADALANLWLSIIDLIHERHPGIPVSFSNTIIGDYIDMEIFDFAGYNAYIYNPVTISQSHGYAGYLRFLKKQRAINMPFIITEYGLSVSPGPPNDEYGYGGNTLEQQTSGNLFMYRRLIDAGAQGNCVFQYHDGWWKGGNEYLHDATPEEWFGLIGFSGLGDIYGTERPVWAAYEKYNKAIIINPKNEQIYQNTVPVELFTMPEVASFTISKKNNVLFAESLETTHYSSELILTQNKEIEDIELVFNFFNSNNDTLKSETISILCSISELELPDIVLDVYPVTLTPGSRNYLNMQVTTNSQFFIENNRIDYVMHPHIGFDPGIAKSKVMVITDNSWAYLDYFDMPPDTKVATFGAGFTIGYGNFKKRISSQKILIYGDWADPIAAPELRTDITVNEKTSGNLKIKLYQNYPNPFNCSTTIKFDVFTRSNVSIKIYDISGREVCTLVDKEFSPGNYREIWQGTNKTYRSVASGVYFIRIQTEDFINVRKIIMIR